MTMEKTTDDWYTPEWVFDGLGLQFDLDVAASSDNSDYVPARRRYTIEDNGLEKAWYGLIWCNPPYSSPTKWCYKYEAHDQGLILIRADLSTRGPYRALMSSNAIWIPEKRLQFVNGRGGRTGAVNFSTVMLGKGPVAVNAMKRLAQINGTTRELH